jgi:hypothetical protein
LDTPKLTLRLILLHILYAFFRGRIVDFDFDAVGDCKEGRYEYVGQAGKKGMEGG